MEETRISRIDTNRQVAPETIETVDFGWRLAHLAAPKEFGVESGVLMRREGPWLDWVGFTWTGLD